jgi:hypothetical protein
MMLVEFASRFVNWLIRPATGRPGPHDLFDANFRRMVVISRHAAADVASVTTPTSLRRSASSTTGVQPQPDVRIACAARAAVSLGVQQDDALIGSMTSLQQLMVCTSRLIELSAGDPRRAGGRVTRRRGDGY